MSSRRLRVAARPWRHPEMRKPPVARARPHRTVAHSRSGPDTAVQPQATAMIGGIATISMPADPGVLERTTALAPAYARLHHGRYVQRAYPPAGRPSRGLGGSWSPAWRIGAHAGAG